MSQEEKLNDTPESAAPASKSKFGKIAILGFIVLVIGVECGAAYFFLANTGHATEEVAAAEPAASEPAPEKEKHEAKAEEKESKHESGHEGKGSSEHETRGSKEPNDQIEVDLSEFSVTAFQPATNTTLRIDFHLYGTVTVKEEKAFLESLKDNEHRFREQVIVIVRSAEITDLTDAGLGLIKRKILEKTNRMLGKQMLHSVIFSDFSFIEQ